MRLPWGGLVLLVAVVAACTEQVTAPGNCPDFCPGGSIAIQDTILTNVIERDSTFLGYILPHQTERMAVADSAGVIDSRAIFRMTPQIPTVSDTIPIFVDSSLLRVTIVRRDTSATNLYLKLYRLPGTIDSTTAFTDLQPDFSVRAVDSVNVSDLLARPAIIDSTKRIVLGSDTLRTDSAGHSLRILGDSSLLVFFDLDTLQAPFVAADSGKLAWGVRVAADSLASVSLGTSFLSGNGTDRDALITWFYHYTKPDTVSTEPDSVFNVIATKGTAFHSFVFAPPNLPVDDNLAVGGVPAARSLLRVAFPAFLRDSSDIARVTLILVPAAPVRGLPSDSFVVLARAVLTDLGGKSPLSQSGLIGRASVTIGSTDTVRIDITDMFRSWAGDTAQATTLALSWLPDARSTTLNRAVVLGRPVEAASYTQIRFFSSRSSLGPSLQVTYIKRFAFGTP